MKVFVVPMDLHKPMEVHNVQPGDEEALKALVGGSLRHDSIEEIKAVMLTYHDAHHFGQAVNARATVFMASFGTYRSDYPFWAGTAVFLGEDEHGTLGDVPTAVTQRFYHAPDELADEHLEALRNWANV